MNTAPLYQIQKNVPIPETDEYKVKRLVRQLEVGDSILIPASAVSEVSITGFDKLEAACGIKLEMRRERVGGHLVTTSDGEVIWRIWRVE